MQTSDVRVSRQHRVSRYHPALVALHWLLAALIIGSLCVGALVLAPMSNAAPQKLTILRFHMAGGLLILALMIVRFVVRLRTARPEKATSRNPLVDHAAPATHFGLYFSVLLMVVTGVATALITDLPAIVFGGSGDPLPDKFIVFPTFVAHSSIAILLAALILLHVAAACYHQFVLKDHLFRRVGFGRRFVN